MLHRVRNPCVIQLQRGALLATQLQKRVLGGKLARIHSVWKNIRILSLDHRYIAIGFHAQQFRTHRTPVYLQQIAVPIEHVADCNCGAAVVRVHQIHQPHDFAGVVVHGRAGQQQQAQICGISHQFIQFFGHACSS